MGIANTALASKEAASALPIIPNILFSCGVRELVLFGSDAFYRR
jgi:hypothetical protein